MFVTKDYTDEHLFFFSGMGDEVWDVNPFSAFSFCVYIYLNLCQQKWFLNILYWNRLNMAQKSFLTYSLTDHWLIGCDLTLFLSLKKCFIWKTSCTLPCHQCCITVATFYLAMDLSYALSIIRNLLLHFPKHTKTFKVFICKCLMWHFFQFFIFKA